MKTATVRELRTAFPRVESWLAEGESVVITKGGRPVAQLIPPPAVVGELDFALRFGPSAKKVVQGRFDATALLSEERDG